MRKTERDWETEREREAQGDRGEAGKQAYPIGRQEGNAVGDRDGPQLSRLLGAGAPTVGVGPSAGKGISSPRWALDSGAGTFHIPHLLPICIPLMADLHPQAFSPEPQSIQNKPGFSFVDAQTSAALLGPVGPHRHRQCQCGTRDGEWVTEGREGESLGD